jgi:hypothetical protein
MSVEFTLGRRMVGDQHPAYFVADIAANHDGQLERAKRLIRLGGGGAQAAVSELPRPHDCVRPGVPRSRGAMSTRRVGKERFRGVRCSCRSSDGGVETCCDDRNRLLHARTTGSPPTRTHVCAWKLGSGTSRGTR